MSMTSEFITAINQISAERGIDKEEIFQALEEAILVAYKKEKFGLDVPEEEKQPNWSVELNRETGEFKLIASKEVVEKAKDVEKEISLSEAEMISPNVEVGDIIQIEMPSEDFGRLLHRQQSKLFYRKSESPKKRLSLASIVIRLERYSQPSCRECREVKLFSR